MKYVLYHSKCYDGFGAAYAAWKKFGDSATYLPVGYGSPPPEMPGATEIFIVDFSYPKAVILALHEKAPVFVLDHHKTAEAELRELVNNEGAEKACNDIGLFVPPGPVVLFDMSRSGAKMAWEYFHHGVPCPRLIEHISDRDLWEFKLTGSAKLHKALVSYPMDFLVWDALDCDNLIAEGETCERLYTSLVNNIVESSWVGRLDGKNVPMVNTSIAWSEVGAALLEKYAPDCPMVASFTVFNDQVMWSLRSIPEFDCSEVAKKFGGGGHKNAAGFKAVKT